MSCTIKFNSDGKINSVLNPDGSESKLFRQIAKLPHVESLEEALEVFKNVYSKEAGIYEKATKKTITPIDSTIFDSASEIVEKMEASATPKMRDKYREQLNNLVKSNFDAITKNLQENQVLEKKNVKNKNMKPIQLPKELAVRLEERLNDEYTAHYFYRNAANYCENAGYTAAANFFSKEAQAELEHASTVQKFLLDWNIKPTLKPISTPVEITGLVDAIEKSYSVELDLYNSYNDDAVFFLDKSNVSAFSFAKSFVEKQTDSIAEFSTLLDKLELIDKDDKNWLYQFQLEEFED